MKIIYSKIALSILVFSFLQSFCSVIPEKKNPEKKSYLVLADKTKFQKTSPKFDYIKVSKFKISSFYENKGFVYKYSDVNFESDFYNEFLTFPIANFQEVFTSWIVSSGIGKLAPGVVNEEKLFFIGGHILSLYGDFSDSKKPKSILEFDLYLQKASDSTILFKKIYNKSIPIKGNNPEELVKGWNLAITEILIEFEKDIRNTQITK